MAHLEPHSTSRLIIAEHPTTHALELPQRFLILDVHLPETGVGLCTQGEGVLLGFLLGEMCPSFSALLFCDRQTWSSGCSDTNNSSQSGKVSWEGMLRVAWCGAERRLDRDVSLERTTPSFFRLGRQGAPSSQP